MDSPDDSIIGLGAAFLNFVSPLCDQLTIMDRRNMRAEPLIGFVSSPETELQVVVGQSLGPVACLVLPIDVQGYGLKVAPEKTMHEIKLLLCTQFAKNSVA